MKTRFGVILLVLLGASQAYAQYNENPYMAVTLAAPSHPWINLTDCNCALGLISASDCNTSSSLLSISWGITSTPTTTTTIPFYQWLNNDWADVFLSADSTCDVVTIEIANAATGTFGASGFTASDIKILSYLQQSSGTYPDATVTPSTLTLQAVLISTVTPDFLTVAGTPTTTGCPAYEENLYFCIRWQDYTTTTIYQTTTEYLEYVGGAPIRFDFTPPGVPQLNSISPGDGNLKVSWTAPSDTDVGSYIITTTGPNGFLKTDTLNLNTDITSTSTANESLSYQITHLTNDVSYDVTVAAVDTAQNVGASSTPLSGTPIIIYDFFRTYKKDLGKDNGGFCFVATAAYGSYQDSMVLPLRRFRDTILSQSSFGRSLIAAYYQYGPRWARAIRDSAFYRTVARGVLLPVVVVAEAINYLGLGVLLLLSSTILFMLYGIRRSRRWRIPKSGPAVGAMLLFFAMAARPIEAQADAQADEPQFQIQVRFGQYHPAVDSEKGIQGHPFRDIFGSGKSWLFEIDTDYEIWRGFGTVTIGGSFGFVQYLGKGLTKSGAKSSDTSALNLFPLRLTAGYHFDMLARWWNIPLVPYVGGGLSYYFWWSTNGVGDISTSLPDANGNTLKGRGGIFGFHVLGGIKFLLDFLDPDAAMNLENSIGIKNTYLFVEYQASFINNFGKSSSMNLSGNNIMFGMMVEF